MGATMHAAARPRKPACRPECAMFPRTRRARRIRSPLFRPARQRRQNFRLHGWVRAGMMVRPMNLPNLLTVGRILLSVIFVVALSIRWPFAYGSAFVLFLVASATDFLDGWLARRTNQVTDFGKLMDPLADKILVTSAMVLLAVERLLPAWFVIVILFREFLVTGVRMLALSQQTVIAADIWGKLKTVFQIVLVCLILGPAGLRELGWSKFGNWELWDWAETTAFYLTLVTTVLSGLLYLRAFLKRA
jgi:CDP-diacylglycerol---glycerol-3-phosphate 3-phosphatidyltransferase